MLNILRSQIRWFEGKIRRDSIDSNSAHVSFFIIISFIPFLMILLSMLQTININGISIMESIISYFPPTTQSFMTYLFDEASQSVALLSISAVAALWTASRAMLAIIKGLHDVFDIKESKNFIQLRLLAIVYTLVFELMLVLTSVLLVFGKTLYHLFLSYFPLNISKAFANLRTIHIFLILMVFFTLTFKLMSRKAKIRLLDYLAGGAFTAAGWVMFSFFFSLFVENFGNYSAIYGSLATIVIFMLWLYFCMYILFLGGEVSVWLHHNILRDSVSRYKSLKNKKDDETKNT